MAFFRRCARLVRIDYAPSQRFNKLLRHQQFGGKPVGLGFIAVPVGFAAVHSAPGVDKFVTIGGSVHTKVRYFVRPIGSHHP